MSYGFDDWLPTEREGQAQFLLEKSDRTENEANKLRILTQMIKGAQTEEQAREQLQKASK